jgi:hypothetical protein
VNSEQAKQILLRYRPGTRDAEDADVAAALELARRDAALGQWLEAHEAFQEGVRAQLRQVRAPDALKSRLLAAHAPPDRIVWLRFPRLLAAAAGIALLLGLAVWWMQPRGEDLTITGYRQRMARTILRDYRMDLLTRDLGEIRRYLTDQQVHSDYVLPKELEQVPGYGCKVLRWQNRPVAMVCLDLGQKQLLYLFVANRSDVPGSPASGPPSFAHISQLTTATWSVGPKVYILAAEGDEAFLRKFVPTK